MGLAPIQRRFQLTSISPGARLCLLTRFLGVRHATTRFLLAQPQRGVRSYENRVSFSYLSDLPLQQLLATLSRLRVRSRAPCQNGNTQEQSIESHLGFNSCTCY